jgi:succinate dehydrogenase / fumarate reductase membrane anchor subunit
MSTSLRTPLARVRGLGSAKEGVGHFIALRVTSIALAILGPWFVISIALTLRGGYDGAIAWLTNPVNAVGTLLFALTSIHHMHLGMQVIVEDYIHKHGTKAALLILNAFVCVVLASATAFAVLKINFGG